MYLLDTNVLSEMVRPHPDRGVVTWLHGVDDDETFMSVVTIGELRFGVERMPSGRRRCQLEAWLEATIDRFDERILSLDVEVANAVGRLLAQREVAGRPVRGNDASIAGTALRHHLTVVTRNVAHFVDTGVDVLNPWVG